MVDTFKKAEKEYHVVLPWYIMTSKENHQETIRFLEEKEYFGYDKSKVKFFMQGELPLLSTEGKLILGKDKKIKEAANGYLDKEPNELNLNDSTLLAGLPNAPSVYQLSNKSNYTYQRQIIVINAMLENNYISKEEAENLINKIRKSKGI